MLVGSVYGLSGMENHTRHKEARTGGLPRLRGQRYAPALHPAVYRRASDLRSFKEAAKQRVLNRGVTRGRVRFVRNEGDNEESARDAQQISPASACAWG